MKPINANEKDQKWSGKQVIDLSWFFLCKFFMHFSLILNNKKSIIYWRQRRRFWFPIVSYTLSTPKNLRLIYNLLLRLRNFNLLKHSFSLKNSFSWILKLAIPKCYTRYTCFSIKNISWGLIWTLTKLQFFSKFCLPCHSL